MKPRTEPPGGTFRCQVLHGWAYGTEEEINRIILDVSGSAVSLNNSLR